MTLSIRSESLSPSFSPASLPALRIGAPIFPTVSGRSAPDVNLSISNIFFNNFPQINSECGENRSPYSEIFVNFAFGRN